MQTPSLTPSRAHKHTHIPGSSPKVARSYRHVSNRFCLEARIYHLLKATLFVRSSLSVRYTISSLSAYSAIEALVLNNERLSLVIKKKSCDESICAHCKNAIYL